MGHYSEIREVSSSFSRHDYFIQFAASQYSETSKLWTHLGHLSLSFVERLSSLGGYFYRAYV